METIKLTLKKIGSAISKVKVKAIMISVIVCFAAATIYAAAANSYSVKIVVDDSEINITTMRESADDILTQANVSLNKEMLLTFPIFQAAQSQPSLFTELAPSLFMTTPPRALSIRALVR